MDSADSVSVRLAAIVDLATFNVDPRTINQCVAELTALLDALGDDLDELLEHLDPWSEAIIEAGSYPQRIAGVYNVGGGPTGHDRTCWTRAGKPRSVGGSGHDGLWRSTGSPAAGRRRSRRRCPCCPEPCRVAEAQIVGAVVVGAGPSC
jgi:hypothetical protein